MDCRFGRFRASSRCWRTRARHRCSSSTMRSRSESGAGSTWARFGSANGERSPLAPFWRASTSRRARSARPCNNRHRVMRAMLLRVPRHPLELVELPDPEPLEGQVRIRVRACGVCRTDLHVLDGELTEPVLPLVLGHQIVGTVDTLGKGVTALSKGQRVGVPWLGGTCGHCPFCTSHRENLCDTPTFTG